MPPVLLNIGHRAVPDDLVDLLAACHDRIRQHLEMAHRLASEGPRYPNDNVRATATQIRRYFTEALPLHIADEERTISPLLVGAGREVASALRTMTSEHEDHQTHIDRLVALCAALAHEPAQLATVQPELAKLVAVLGAELEEHLALEERIVFPALQTLTPFERSYILTTMRLRREQATPPS